MTITLSGELAHNLLELAPDATVVIDTAGTVVFANARIERTLGYHPSEIVGQSVELLLPPRLRGRHLEHRAAFALHPTPRPMGEGSALFGQHKSGREIPVEISLSPVRGNDGTLVVAAIRDATHHHDHERKLLEASQHKTRLLAAASHDLRQPVQTLMLLNQTALHYAEPNSKLQDLLRQQQAALDTMAVLLTSVLDVSTLDSGGLTPTVGNCAINDVLQRLRSDFEPQAEDKGIALVVDPTTAGGRTDPELLRRILGNLLSNAIRYTARGSVHLNCVVRGDDIAITVRDTGVGMPSGELGKIFDEFYQIDRGSQRPEGLGLGLSIVRRLAALLGHRITVESVVGEGTAFTITLPRVALVPAPRPSAGTNVGARERGRILIIDDELSVAQAMGLLLEIEGFDVDLASGKRDAIDRATASAPDVILSDYQLRGAETGAQVVDAVRTRLGKAIPAIFVTGDTSKLASVGTQLANATLLSKPTRAEELLTAIHRHVVSSTLEATNTYGHDDARRR